MDHSGERPVADYFSAQAADYATYRPHYPPELFASLAVLAPGRHLAWDCATGNGQAAVPLAHHFERVIATDASADQLAQTVPHAGVEYRLARAEASGLETASVDLVTVAQALHWFDLDAFYTEVRRVLAPRGVLAVSSYGSAELDTPELARILNNFEWGVMGSYWPDRRSFVGEALRDLPFPFEELPVPPVALDVQWTLTEVVGYARSWSATARYVKEHGTDPTSALDADLRTTWGPPELRRTVRWPFVIRVGRV